MDHLYSLQYDMVVTGSVRSAENLCQHAAGRKVGCTSKLGDHHDVPDLEQHVRNCLCHPYLDIMLGFGYKAYVYTLADDRLIRTCTLCIGYGV